MQWLPRISMACLAALLFPVMSLAQTGRIEGKVADDKGNAIAFANVLLEGTHMGAATNVNGDYSVTNVPPGSYSVRASAIGYRMQSAMVRVSADKASRQDFALAADILRMEEVVVTGVRTPRMKMETPVAISTLSPRELEEAAPRSTTEMLRYVPGFTRVESSGGEVNQNISVRGILGVEFVMFMEDGMPVFPTMHTFFMNADNLFRPDENIEKIEVVRGGNSALFGSNTPGAIINFISKTGGPELGGVVKATGGTEGIARYDFNVNGPLGNNWRFNLGGFYRYDNGVRDPGFPGIRGGQLKGNITRLLDNGYVRVSAKFIDDRNQFILPLPFNNPADPEYVVGFSDYGSMNTIEGIDLRIPLPRDNGELKLPLDDGIRTNAWWLTGEVGFDFENGWSIQNTAQIMKDDQSWNAILPFDVLTAGDFAQARLDELVTAGVVPSGSSYQLYFTNHLNNLGNKLPFNTPNGLVAPGGQWHVEKPLSAFQDQFQIKKQVGKHNLTLGSYLGYYSQQNTWYFTQILTDVRDNPRFVDMVVTTPTGGTVEVTQNGFRKFLDLYVSGSGHTSIASVFASGEFKLTDRVRLDLTGRYEHDNFVQVSQNTTNIDLDGDPTTVYDVENWGNETFRHFNYSFDQGAWSAGLNYSVNDQLSLYGQASGGFKMPALDEYIFPAEAQAALFKPRHTTILEVGGKYAGKMVAASLTGFWGELRDIFSQGAEVDPVTGGTIWVVLDAPKTKSYGAEVEVSARPTPEIRLLGSGAFIEAKLGSGADLGSLLAGVPPVIGNMKATYSKSGFTLLADWHYVGRRYLENQRPGAAKDKLKAYSYINLGASYMIPGQAITLSADLLNVNQSKGLEEGNPRLRQVGGRTSDLFLARPILPRRLIVSAAYRF